MVAVVVAMIVLVPLLTGSTLLNNAGKLFAFEILGAVLLVLMLAQAQFSEPRAAARALRAGPNLPIILLVFLSGISWALSPYKAFSLTELLRVGFCAAIYFALAYWLRGKFDLQFVLDALLLTTALVSLLGLAQMGQEQANGDVVEGTFGSHELLGSFLLLMLPMALALGLTERGEPKRQMAAQVVSLLAVACLLAARTRSAWVGGAVSLVVLSLLAARFSGQVILSARRKHLIIGPLAILMGAVVLFVALSQLGPLLGRRAATLTSVAEDGSFQSRVRMWRGTARMISARPLLGWGVGSYPVREAAWTFSGDSAARVLARGTSHSNLAHNFYLQTAAEIGVVGLGLYVAAILAFFAAGLRALASLETGLRKTVLVGALAAMAGQVIDAFGSPAYNFASVSLFQWALMGLGMFAARSQFLPNSAAQNLLHKISPTGV